VISFSNLDARGHFSVNFNFVGPKLVCYYVTDRKILQDLKKLKTQNQGLGKPYFIPGKAIFPPILLKIGIIRQH
jgi:hypothetical protein